MKWIEWKKREIYPEFVVQINCCTIERNDEHRNGVHRAIIEIHRGLSADVSNPSLPSHYHLYIGRVPEIYRYDKNFNDKIYSFIIANEKRIIQNWEIVPITALNEKEQDNARRVYKLWGSNSNSAQYQINQYISQLEEQEREEFQTPSIAEEQPPLSSPNPADPAQPSTSSQLQENEVDEADGDWVRADVWAADHSKVDGRPSKSMKKLILGNLSSARERSEETQNEYKGRNIFKDGAGREYFKISYRVCYYKKKQLENDLEFLTSHNH